ncbi:hypothetical protein AVEN_103725-1 [Araneus ventricosus]|uniref:Uncharacterized protein n=1 Tax=Araneus ventricosus TaxID=182803 RepID=A0A4Y2SNF8_ARAVE|nr:hypothetical protein AVEN_103725-1 [Araneus ventricosus]
MDEIWLLVSSAELQICIKFWTDKLRQSVGLSVRVYMNAINQKLNELDARRTWYVVLTQKSCGLYQTLVSVGQREEIRNAYSIPFTIRRSRTQNAPFCGTARESRDENTSACLEERT